MTVHGFDARRGQQVGGEEEGDDARVAPQPPQLVAARVRERSKGHGSQRRVKASDSVGSSVRDGGVGDTKVLVRPFGPLLPAVAAREPREREHARGVAALEDVGVLQLAFEANEIEAEVWRRGGTSASLSERHGHERSSFRECA